MSEGIQPSYVYNVLCPVCGFKYLNTELKRRWDGLMVCPDDWEPRNILDFYKNRSDSHVLPFIYPDDNPVKALTFNGTSSYVTVPFAASRASIGASFTLQMSIYPTDVTSRQVLMSTLAGATANSWDLEVGPGNDIGVGRGRLLLRHVSGQTQIETLNDVIVANRWNTISYTRDSATSRQLLVVNGAPVAAKGMNFTGVVSNVDTWYLGSFDGAQLFFNGYMKDVRLYTAVRNLNQLIIDQTIIPSTSTTNLQNWWLLNEGTGTTLADHTATGANNATAVNTTWSEL